MANAELYIKTGGANVTSAYLAPSGDATWTGFTSNVEATLALACEDAGYIVVDLGGTDYRVPLLTTA